VTHWEAIASAIHACLRHGKAPEEILLSVPLLAALQADSVPDGRLTPTILFGRPYVVQAQLSPRVVASATWFPIEWEPEA
jgi:hypothetical protein